MGVTFSRSIYGSRNIRVLMAGLDAAGKTTMLYKLKLGEIVTAIPTIGFNVETIDVDGVKITAWDVGLRDKSRPLLRHYYPNTHAIIYVVDSLDQDRMDEVKELLYYTINDDELRGVPLLVMANKQDSPKACPPEKIADALGLRDLQNRPWHIVPCSATNGTGVYEGLQWLVGVITGNMVKKDVTQSLTTSVKDVTETTSQLQQKAGLANLGLFYKGLEFLQGLTGCKAKKQLTVVTDTMH